MSIVNSTNQMNLMYAFTAMQRHSPSYFTGVTNSCPVCSPFSVINVPSEAMQKYAEFQKDSKSFYSDFYPSMKDLKSSSKALSKTDFATDAQNDVIDRINNFAEDYNAAIDVFKDHDDILNGNRDLEIELGETRFKSRYYASIGLNIDSSGRISVDEDKLKDALTNNPDSVEELLGKKGLSGQTKKRVASGTAKADDMISLPRAFTQPDSKLYLGRSSIIMYPGMMYSGMLFDFFI